MNSSNDNSTGDEYQHTKLQFVYLIRLREQVRLNENIYKIGKTTQTPNKRLNGYPKHSELNMFIQVANCNKAEKNIIDRFDKVFNNQSQYGREYYKGDISLMRTMLFNICTELEVSNLRTVEVASPVQVLPSSVQVLPSFLQVLPYSAQVLPSFLQVLPTPVQVLPTPVQVIPSPVQVLPSPVQVIASSVQVLPTPVQVLPSPVQVLPTPVQVLPTPVQVLPTPVQVLPTPVQVLPTPVEELPSPVEELPSPVEVSPSSVEVLPPVLSIKNFYKHLYNTKPSWYSEDKLVDMEYIVIAYRIFFGDDSTRSTIISRKLKGGLYNIGFRINNVTKKKLVTYDVLKTLY